jgi:hypothetical protein
MSLTASPDIAAATLAVYAEEEASFFKGITANILAKAIFRGGMVYGTLDPNVFPLDELNQHWMSAVKVVISKFKVYHLEAAVPTQTKWKATNLGSPCTSVSQQKVGLTRNLRFCCLRCKERGIWSLLGVGECVIVKGQCGIQMKKVFFHDKECFKTKEEKLPSYQFNVFDFDFDEVIGNTYDSVVHQLQQCSFHDKETDMPPGHSINFGFDDYNFDDRAYEYMPSPNYPDIESSLHRESLVRVLFMMATDLNMADEVSHTVLDLKKYTADLNDSNKAGICKEMLNTEYHLHFFELSLLFGGHCMLAGEENSNFVVDQIVHKDGETSEGEIANKAELMGKHKPGSFIIPLDEARSIFVCTPQLLVTAKRGQYIWFHGALPHGGKTYKASKEGKDWRPALHGHLDSIHHARKRGDFAFEGSDNVYFPLEHARFMKDLFPILERGLDTSFNVMSLIHKRATDKETGAEYLQSLSPRQVATYNSHLCGQYSELKTLPMGSTELLDQISLTAKRLEELILSKPVDKLNENSAEKRKSKANKNKLEKIKSLLMDGSWPLASVKKRKKR